MGPWDPRYPKIHYEMMVSGEVVIVMGIRVFSDNGLDRIFKWNHVKNR
jgi:hypothetical protein